VNIIAIDFSKVRTGIFIKNEGVESASSITNKAWAKQETVLVKLYNEFTSILNNKKIDIGFIEGYAFNPKNRSGMIPMSEYGGIIKLVFALAGIPLVVIPVQTWKSIIKIKMNKNKNPDKYLKIIADKFGREFQNIDEADAFLIYKTARLIAKGGFRLSESAVKIRKNLKKIIDKIKG
jgi:Holliday junction resolvasome RuvABC endonuclease subunit